VSTKERFFASQDYETKVLDVPKWGAMRVRELTAQERLDLVEAVSGEDLKNEEACEWFCKLIAMSAIEDDGQPIFDMNGDIQKLKQKPWRLLQDIANQIMSFNGMEDTEEAAKN
jgi:hypothetical protein